MKKQSTAELAQLSLFVAIIVMLAVTPLGYIPLVVINATIVHVPVIIGSITMGPKKGAFLGFVFGLTSFLRSTFFPSSLMAFVFSPFITVGGATGNFWSLVICFVPRILVGVVPFFVYRILKKGIKNDAASLLVAGIAGSMTNTILVMNMIFVFFGKQYAAVNSIEYSGLYGVIIGIIGMNGIPEAIVAGLISMAVCKVLMKYIKTSTIQSAV